MLMLTTLGTRILSENLERDVIVVSRENIGAMLGAYLGELLFSKQITIITIILYINKYIYIINS